MANTILTMDQITFKSLQVLENNLVLGRNVNREYDSSFAQKGAKIGSTLRVRKPQRFLVSDGAALQVQNSTEDSVTLAVTSQKHVDVNFTTAEMALSLDDFSNRILKPAMSQLAATIDADLATFYTSIGQSVGTPGTTPATSQVLLSGQQKLNESAAPMSPRYATVNPAANASLVEGMKGLFQPTDTVSRQFKSGMMGTGVLGYDEINMSQSIAQFTTGSRTAGATIATTALQGASTLALTTNGATDTLKAGDVFTVAACYAVNPQTRQSTGSLYQFVVLADAVAAGSAVTVTVAPIYDKTHALATVDALPAATGALTFIGAASTQYPQNLIYHPDAVTLATADLVMPQGIDMASRVVHNGISLRIVRAYDINNDQMPCRIDVLYGFKVIRPELAVRLWG